MLICQQLHDPICLSKISEWFDVWFPKALGSRYKHRDVKIVCDAKMFSDRLSCDGFRKENYNKNYVWYLHPSFEDWSDFSCEFVYKLRMSALKKKS